MNTDRVKINKLYFRRNKLLFINKEVTTKIKKINLSKCNYYLLSKIKNK